MKCVPRIIDKNLKIAFACGLEPQVSKVCKAADINILMTKCVRVVSAVKTELVRAFLLDVAKTNGVAASVRKNVILAMT